MKPTILILGGNLTAVAFAVEASKQGFPVKMITGEDFLCPFLTDEKRGHLFSGTREIMADAKEMQALFQGLLEENQIELFSNAIPSGVILEENTLTGISMSKKDGIYLLAGDVVIDTEGFLMAAPLHPTELLEITAELSVYSREEKTPLVFDSSIFDLPELTKVSLLRSKINGEKTLKFTFKKEVPFSQGFSKDYFHKDVMTLSEHIVRTLKEKDFGGIVTLYPSINSLTVLGHKNPSIDYPSSYHIFKKELLDTSIPSLFEFMEEIKEPVSVLLSELESDDTRPTYKKNHLLTGDILIPLADEWTSNQKVSFPKRTFVKRVNTDVFISGQGALSDALKETLSDLNISYVSDSEDRLLVGTETDENHMVHAVLSDASGIFSIRAKLFIDAGKDSMLSEFTAEEKRENLSPLSSLQEEAYKEKDSLFIPPCDYDFTFDDIIEPAYKKDLILFEKEASQTLAVTLSAFLLKARDNVLSTKFLFAPGLFSSPAVLLKDSLDHAVSFETEKAAGTTLGYLAALCIEKNKIPRELSVSTIQSRLTEAHLLQENLRDKLPASSINAALNLAATGQSYVLPLLYLHTDEVRESATFMARLDPENETLQKLARWCEEHPSSLSNPEDQMLSFF